MKRNHLLDGFPQLSHVQEIARILLAQCGLTPTQTVREKWVYNFINQYNEIKT
jgi:hypothetical protein